MNRKTADLADVNADPGEGMFTALASVFHNTDRVGDRVMPGAFSKSLAKWRASGDPIPVVFSHKWDDIYAHVGIADPNDVRETHRGLEVTGTLDIHDNPVAAQLYKLMKRRSLKAWSFGYQVVDQRTGPDGVNELHELDLHEVGPTLVGANPDAGTQAIKSALADLTDTRTPARKSIEQRLAALGVVDRKAHRELEVYRFEVERG